MIRKSGRGSEQTRCYCYNIQVQDRGELQVWVRMLGVVLSWGGFWSELSSARADCDHEETHPNNSRPVEAESAAVWALSTWQEKARG